MAEARGEVAFYKQKQKARGGVEEKFVDVIRISPAEGETSLASS